MPETSIALETRNGLKIENSVEQPVDPALRAIRDQELSRMVLPPSTNQVSGHDPTYNCTGHIFAARRVFVHTRAPHCISNALFSDVLSSMPTASGELVSEDKGLLIVRG